MGISLFPFPRERTSGRDTRGIKRNPETDVMTVYVQVKEYGCRSLATVLIADRFTPDELEFEWNSAKVGDKAVRVSGANPYEFNISDLPGGAETILSYNAIAKKSSRVSVTLS